MLALFDSGEEFLHSVFQLVSHLINLFGITFTGVRQFFRRRQQLVSVGHSVLEGGREGGREGKERTTDLTEIGRDINVPFKVQ